MMDKLQRKVLEHLLDSYERSKTFQGENQVNQSFSVNIGKLFPRYRDDAEYDYFCQINEAMEELGGASLVALEYERRGILKKVRLNLEQLEACYSLLGRTPRKQEQQELMEMWDELGLWNDGEDAGQETEGRLVPLQRYIEAQRIRVGKNQSVEHYEHDLGEYRNLLLAAKAVLENREEIFIRHFSMQLFHDSKKIEQLISKLEALLYQYGGFQEKGAVLEECGIVHTPTYVMMKGNGVLTLGGCRPGNAAEQKIDLSLLSGDIALSTESIKNLTGVVVLGKRVVTVENLTSFHDYTAGEDFVIYLGGFHNKVKRDFLIYLYQQNPEKEYRHFGDIDAGGFYILEHLKRKTGIAFRSLHMNVAILQQYEADQKSLTENDRRRLQQLREILQEQKRRGECVEDYGEVIDYMMRKGCKLEQEAVRQFDSER